METGNVTKKTASLPANVMEQDAGKGLGVFAIDHILEGEIIEECHLISLNIPLNIPSDILTDYRFLYPVSGEHLEHVIPSGYGCIYNHSDNNNAFWRDHPISKPICF